MALDTIITKLQNGNVVITKNGRNMSYYPDMQVLEDEGDSCHVRDKSSSMQHVFNVDEVIKVVRRDGTETPINDKATLFYELSTFFFFKLGSGGSTHLGVFDNYTDLITQYPTSATGDLAYCENSQGTAWLPGGMGGTFYSKGVYMFNGANWDSSVDEISKQLEDNINDITSLQTALTTHVNDLNNPHDTSDANLNVSDITTNDVSISAHGFAPKLPNNPNVYLNGQGNYTTPAGGGGSEVIVVTNRAPNENDDVTTSNFVGQRWIDNSTTPRSIYICRDATDGFAQWEYLNYPPQLRYQNVQVVQTLDDFPAPVGTEIILENKTYLIDAIKLDITGYTIKYGQRSSIQGFNQNVSSIQSKEVGATLIRSTTNLFMNDVEIFMSANNQTLFDHQGDGTTPEGESFEINKMAVYCQDDLGNFMTGCKAGIIKDIRQGFMGTQFYLGLADGFKFAGHWVNGGMRITDTLFRAFAIMGQTGKIFYSDPTDPVIWDSRFSSNANIQVNGSSIGYDFPETAFTFNGQYQLQNGNASGTGTFVSDFTSGFPAYDPIGNFKNNTGIQDTFPGGEWINNIDSLTTINTQNVWEQLILTTNNKGLTWFSETNGVFDYLSDTPLDVTILLTVTLVGKANDVVEVKIVKEDSLAVQTDVLTRQVTIKGTLAQGRAESVPLISTDQLVFGDKIKIYVRNTSGTTDITTLIDSNCIIGAK